MRAGDNLLFPLLHDYLKIYLPKQRNVSPNTIRSYRKALEELLDYVKERRQIPLQRITFEYMTSDIILEFLEYLELERGCSIPTRNTRFAAIRAFMDYAADHDVSLVADLNRLKKIPFKKVGNIVAVDYMSMSAVTAIIGQTDTSTSKGLRDRVFLILLYDTGARVQEILDIRLCDLQLGRLPKVTLFGKGRKTRTVPLMEKTAQHLQKYLSLFHADAPFVIDSPLFYSIT
jgi:Site-specific recombinase XerD